MKMVQLINFFKSHFVPNIHKKHSTFLFKTQICFSEDG